MDCSTLLSPSRDNNEKIVNIIGITCQIILYAENKSIKTLPFTDNTNIIPIMIKEIKNPVSKLMNDIEKLKATKMKGNQLIAFSSLEDSSLMLLSTLNDVIDITKIEADKMPICNNSVNLKNGCYQAVFKETKIRKMN